MEGWLLNYTNTNIYMDLLDHLSSTFSTARRSWGLQVQREARWNPVDGDRTPPKGEVVRGYNKPRLLLVGEKRPSILSRWCKIQGFEESDFIWANVVVWNCEDCDSECCYGMGLQFGSSVAKRNGWICLLLTVLLILPWFVCSCSLQIDRLPGS